MNNINELLIIAIKNKSTDLIHSLVSTLNVSFEKKQFIMINKGNEVFNETYSYGIGFINGEYRLEIQEPVVSGDRPYNWFKTCSSEDIEKIIEYIVQYEEPDACYYM